MGDRRRRQMEGDSKRGAEQRIVESCVCTANSSAFVFVVNGKAEAAFLDVHPGSALKQWSVVLICQELYPHFLCTLWFHTHTLQLSLICQSRRRRSTMLNITRLSFSIIAKLSSRMIPTQILALMPNSSPCNLALRDCKLP
jgi:hypothetical protein